MRTKQKAASLIVRLLLTVGLLWGAWYECGPFTWMILCLMTANIELRILAAWLDRSNDKLDEALRGMRATLIEMRRKNDLKNGGPDHDDQAKGAPDNRLE